MKQKKAVLKNIHSFLPSGKLTNEELAQEFPEWNVDKIFNKTGIQERRIAGKNECASDLGVAAAKKLFLSGACMVEDIDFLIFCTQSPDYFLPSTACIVQKQLGLSKTCGALDINLGCSGYVYGLSLAKGLIETSLAKNVLLITSDTYSKYINASDRSVRTIFGDGASATLITSEELSNDSIGPFVFGTDGDGANQLIVPAGGLRMPPTPFTSIEKEVGKGIFRSEQNLYMNGSEILNFTLKIVPIVVKQLLLKRKISIEDINYFVFHQANRFILEGLMKKMKIPENKFCINMENHGNTVSSSIPMAMEIAIKHGQIKKGDTVMLIGFGVGLSWAGTLIKHI